MEKMFASHHTCSTMPIPLTHHSGVLQERRKFTTGNAQRAKCVSKHRFVGHAGGNHSDGSTQSLEPRIGANAIVATIKKGPVRAHFFSQRAITRVTLVVAARASCPLGCWNCRRPISRRRPISNHRPYACEPCCGCRYHPPQPTSLLKLVLSCKSPV